jgi:hypothetical protein
MKIRHGYYARWRGEEYEASPDGSKVHLYAETADEGFEEAGPERFVRVVPAAEVELSYISMACTWQDEPFQVLGEYDTWVRVEYAGERPEAAVRLGLEVFDRDVYQAWAPRADIRGLREERS